MNDAPVFISIVTDHMGERDVEVLDVEPADSFKQGLLDLFHAEEIRDAEIRVGNMNGGDSVTVWSTWQDDDEPLPCPTCHAAGSIDGSTCPACLGSGSTFPNREES